LRIISGSARGRRLFTPANFRIRPTADRVKESLFNILGNILVCFDHCRVLDIFAGTGNLGLEALSRGASQAVFVDNHRESVSLVLKNIQLLGFAGKARVLEKEAIPALRYLEQREESFRLVFIDPPYQMGLTEKILEYLGGSSLVDDNSLVVAEFSAREVIPREFSALREFDRRVYGDTAIGLFRMAEGNEVHQ
jgi:16S rRNA (guanine(966)-N(2))-methyltransferase RsmD